MGKYPGLVLGLLEWPLQQTLAVEELADKWEDERDDEAEAPLGVFPDA